MNAELTFNVTVWLKFILSAVIGYLLGSISVGVIVSKLSGGPDLHEVGSKSTGATNALRTMGKKRGAIVFLGDVFKAQFACLFGWLITGHFYGVLLAGLMAIIGHNWPVFFGFKGGKGVSSTVGVMLCTFPVAAAICDVLTIVMIALTRYVSVGSMYMVVLFSMIVSVFFAQGNWIVVVWTVVIAVMCIARHHANIDRLLHGTENRLGGAKKSDRR